MIALALGALAILGASLLPIEDGIVRRHTAERLTRQVLSTLADGVAAGREVRLDIEAASVERAAIEAAVAGFTRVDGEARRRVFVPAPGAADVLRFAASGDDALVVEGRLGDVSATEQARLAGWTSLLPPLVALVLAIALRRVVVALFAAVLLGAVLLSSSGPLGALWVELKSMVGVALTPVIALLSGVGVELANPVAVDGYISKVLVDTFNLQILGFTFALVGLIAVVSRMGGTRGLVDALSPFARGRRSAQTVTAAMGTAVFFDDYANTVVIGTTARSLTDRHRISREKLAYIVDSTSAPVAGIAVVSTWIGYEVGLFDDLLGSLSAVPGLPGSGYELFFTVLPMRFYCLFALALVFITALSGRDLGPMYRAERRARRGEGLSRARADEGGATETLTKAGVPARAYNAVLPIGVVLATVLGLLIYRGAPPDFSPFSFAGWKAVFETAGDDIAEILLLSALVGTAVTFALALGQRLLSLREAAAAYGEGMRTLLEAAAILIGAWGIKSVCDDLGTGLAIVAIVGDALPAVLIPLVVFLLSGLVAFCTGTSWGTMALVLPIAAPLSATLSGEPLVVLASLGAVLDGAIWGDHCSPISDTTVLSSTASGCPHLDHVRTQLPYATLAMVAAGGAGYLGLVAGLPLWASYALGLAAMVGVVIALGRDPDDADAGAVRNEDTRSAGAGVGAGVGASQLDP